MAIQTRHSPAARHADGTQRRQDLERRVLRVVGEQAALARPCHVLGALDHIGSGGIAEGSLSHATTARSLGREGNSRPRFCLEIDINSGPRQLYRVNKKTPCFD